MKEEFVCAQVYDKGYTLLPDSVVNVWLSAAKTAEVVKKGCVALPLCLQTHDKRLNGMSRVADIARCTRSAGISISRIRPASSTTSGRM